QLVEDLRGSVGGPVVDGDDFGLEPIGQGRVHRAQDRRREELFFVVDGDDDRKQPFGGQAVIVPRVWRWMPRRAIFCLASSTRRESSGTATPGSRKRWDAG